VRILHVCADAGIPLDGSKGASVHLRSLAGALAQDHEVVLAVRRIGAGAAVSTGTGGAGPVVTLPLDGPAALDGAVARYGVPDVVYERYSLGHLDGLALARRLGRPFVLEMNAPLAAEAQQHRPGTVRAGDAEAEIHLLREADLVITVSSPLRDHVAGVRGPQPTVVIHNGFDPDLFTVCGPKDPTPTIGFLGHPKPWHGADLLPEVLRRLRDRGHDARLLVVGGGPGADDVAHAADVAGVAPHVEITGPLPQVDAIAAIARAWIGLAPYAAVEPFYFSPIKLVEYLAAGLAVVATTVGDLADIVGDGGVLVAPGDMEALVDAVDGLLSDGAARQEIADRGRRHIMFRHTWSAVADRTVAAIEELVPRQP
jgi:glycosyltransferase involved in cell wall biosynthesis